MFSSALYFWLIPFCHYLNKENIDIFNELYFSIVTFTPLGYGGLSTIGYDRLIATLIVGLGLIFIALLVKNSLLKDNK
ncbi:ion channel [Acinetobacter colistiniresistens]|uniref:ion channel n=1 Tax=Acinetobacter colistiniresistens TaxID=280145 RepID=UPI0035A24393